MALERSKGIGRTSGNWEEGETVSIHGDWRVGGRGWGGRRSHRGPQASGWSPQRVAGAPLVSPESRRGSVNSIVSKTKSLVKA